MMNIENDPRTAAWLAAVLADRPPRTPEMTAILRRLWAPAVPAIRAAALQRALDQAAGL
jgi:hypothetical protein